jgi:hypothetical protein
MLKMAITWLKNEWDFLLNWRKAIRMGSQNGPCSLEKLGNCISSTLQKIIAEKA